MDCVQFRLMFSRDVGSELPAQVGRASQELEVNGTLAQIRDNWLRGLPSKRIESGRP